MKQTLISLAAVVVLIALAGTSHSDGQIFDVRGATFSGLQTKAKFKLKKVGGFTGEVSLDLFLGPQDGVAEGRFRLLDTGDGLDVEGTYELVGKKVVLTPDLDDLIDFLSIEEFILGLADDNDVTASNIEIDITKQKMLMKVKQEKVTGGALAKKLTLKVSFEANAMIDGEPDSFRGKISAKGKPAKNR